MAKHCQDSIMTIAGSFSLNCTSGIYISIYKYWMQQFLEYPSTISWTTSKPHPCFVISNINTEPNGIKIRKGISVLCRSYTEDPNTKRHSKETTKVPRSWRETKSFCHTQEDTNCMWTKHIIGTDNKIIDEANQSKRTKRIKF